MADVAVTGIQKGSRVRHKIQHVFPLAMLLLCWLQPLWEIAVTPAPHAYQLPNTSNLPQAMKNFHKLLIAMGLTGLSITAACNRFPLGGCIEGNGEVITENRTLEPFHSIVVDGSMDVAAGASGGAIAEAANLLPIITTTIQNGG